jgi:hypothetical protein
MATCRRWCEEASVEQLVKTHISDAMNFRGNESGYDVVGLFYAHTPHSIRQQFHRRAVTWLKPGGKLILEGFNTNQLGLSSGGPKDRSMLFSIDQLQNDFKGLKVEQLETIQVVLNEGPFHQGNAEIIRMIGSLSKD